MRPSLRPPWPLNTTLLRWHPRAPQRTPRRIATTSTANASPIDVPKLIISPGSKYHDSLPSFLEYAKRVNLPTDTTVYVGTHYEYTAALSLMRLGFSLLRIGRSNDAGIDLIGHWALPPLREPMPTIIQCKARKCSVHPSHIRELEGSFQGIPADWKKKDVLGLLVTTRKATKGTMDALGQSRWPMGFVLVTRDGTVQQFVWNRAAAERGLEGVGVTVRHTPLIDLPLAEQSADEDGRKPLAKSRKVAAPKPTGTKRDIQLTWLGSPISADRSQLTQETKELVGSLNLGDCAVSIRDEMYDSKRWKADTEKTQMGRPRTIHKAPSPRGGLIPGKRGRRATVEEEEHTTRKQKIRTKAVESTTKPVAVKRGRPKGSKNKPKVSEVD